MSPPLLCIHLWQTKFSKQQQSALDQVQSAFAQQEKSTPRTARAISLHSRIYQPSTQQAVQLSLVTQHEQLPLDQQEQSVLAKQARSAFSHSRCNEPSHSKRIQSSPTADSISQVIAQPEQTTNGQVRGWPLFNDATIHR